MSTILATTAVASAKPNLEVDGGVTVGADAAMHHEAAFVAGEVPLTKTFRLHGLIARGQADANTNEMSFGPNVYMALRAGIETRLCASDAVCALLGVDGALLTESYRISDSFDSGTSLGSFAAIEERGGLAVVPRLSLDVGGEHWRFRPGLEATLSATANDGTLGHKDLIGVAGNAAVAYQW